MIEYLPLFMRVFEEIKAIMNTEQVDVGNAWIDSDDVLKNQFVVDATEEGVSRYEQILGIKPKATYTLDERKFNVLARMNEQLPYTMEQLHSSLVALCGEEGYALSMNNDSYTLMVKLSLYNENNVQAVVELLDKMVPANIVKKVMLFNTHLLLSDFTHEQLAAFTHKALREAVI